VSIGAALASGARYGSANPAAIIIPSCVATTGSPYLDFLQVWT
jgi:hypothetical protein